MCYIDPPFNSKRNYNQIYNNIDKDDIAQSQAFIDTWCWDNSAEQGMQEILERTDIYNIKTIDLINGLCNVLSRCGMFAYLVYMTRRIVEIQRILKHTGSFYLHCDTTSSHYLKILCDTIFCRAMANF